MAKRDHKKIERERQRDSDDELASIVNNENLEHVYDEIQNKEAGEISQFEENRKLIYGREIIDLCFKWTRDESEAAEIGASNVYADSPPPLPGTVERMKKLVKACIADGVTVGDLKLVKGDMEQDFDTCQFPATDTFLLIKQRNILSTLRDEGILIRPDLEAMVDDAERADVSPQDTPEDDNCTEITFHKRGEVWEVGIEKVLIFNDIIGLPYIEYAFQRPNEYIPCLDLAKLIKQPGIDEAGESWDTDGPTEGVGQLTDNMAPCSDGPDEDLDEENRKIWEEDVRGLRQDLAKLKKTSPDYDTIKEALEEAETNMLAFYDGKGNLRNDNPPEDKARINVSRAIAGAKNKIIKELPEMKEYLKHIKTGATIRFDPPVGMNIRIK